VNFNFILTLSKESLLWKLYTILSSILTFDNKSLVLLIILTSCIGSTNGLSLVVGLSQRIFWKLICKLLVLLITMFYTVQLMLQVLYLYI